MRAWFIGCLAVLILGCGAADAGNRIAIVIGNGSYRNVENLPNTLNDANDIAASLDRLGFTVNKIVNATYEDMRRGFLDFGRRARDADMAIVYFAGHGMEVAGENWLIPIDAKLEADTDAEHEAIALKSVVNTVASTSKLGLVILDACRNNPFAAKMLRKVRARSVVARGFARVEPADNVLVAYAAKDGTTASDGSGRNSPFTGALLRHLETPGLEINLLFRTVRDDVMGATQREQQPFVYGSLSKELIYLKGAPHIPGPSASTTPSSDEVFWSTIRDSSAPALFEEFLRKFPQSARAGEARARLEEIKRSLTAAVAPPVRPASPCGPGPAVGVFVSRSAKALSTTEECALKPLDVFKECEKCPEMVMVPAGTFLMGSPDSEPERYSNEEPMHRVTFAQPFAAGRFAVTFEEWDACVAAGGCNGYRPSDNNWGRGRRPVINVSWEDAKTYVAWLSRTTGATYRLLSEAEREYVTRAGTTTPFWWGYSISTRQANYDGNYVYNGGVKGEVRQRTVPVDYFDPNPWKLYQVHGNIWEWVEDCWIDSYDKTAGDGSPRITDKCGSRALRGGSWIISPWNLRAADRFQAKPTDRAILFGFRVARTLRR
jgi:formylglycine-generating enzyme required for sulfatase activity